MTNTEQRRESLESLEQIVDGIGMAVTVDLLREIACLKAEHLLCNWQDKPAAKAWTRDANKLDTLSRKLEN